MLISGLLHGNLGQFLYCYRSGFAVVSVFHILTPVCNFKVVFKMDLLSGKILPIGKM